MDEFHLTVLIVARKLQTEQHYGPKIVSSVPSQTTYSLYVSVAKEVDVAYRKNWLC